MLNYAADMLKRMVAYHVDARMALKSVVILMHPAFARHQGMPSAHDGQIIYRLKPCWPGFLKPGKLQSRLEKASNPINKNNNNAGRNRLWLHHSLCAQCSCCQIMKTLSCGRAFAREREAACERMSNVKPPFIPSCNV